MNAELYSYKPELIINDAELFRREFAKELSEEYDCRCLNRIGIGGGTEDLYGVIAFRSTEHGQTFYDIIAEIDEEFTTIYKVDYEEIDFVEVGTLCTEGFLSAKSFKNAIIKIVDENICH